VEALKILEKVMSSANKKPYDAELIYGNFKFPDVI